MAIGRPSVATELSKLVVEALVQLGLTERDVLGGAIVHTDLPWQVPPLVVEATLFGASLSEYIDRPTYVDVDQLVTMYSDCLSDMRNAPRKVLMAEGYRIAHLALPRTRMQERHMIFSLPDGFPGPVGDYAGVTLALECAHVLRTNAKISAFISDDDNYFAVLPDGMEVGVKDGLPTVWYDQWDFSVEGMVQELLHQPRGAVWEGCDYNVISQVRSVCKVFEKSMREHEAVDWALQALRVIEGERELLRAMRSIKTVAYERGERMRSLQEAVEIAHAMAITDRQRIEALKGMLVPDILSVSQFSKQIYNFYAKVPPVVAPKVLSRIQEGVQAMLDQEEALYAKINPGKFN
jgi:hypothetical protein